MTTPIPGTSISVYNGRLDTASDTRLVRVLGIQYGLDIVSNEDQGRLNSTFYPAYTDSNQFSLSIVTVNYAEKDNLEQWFKNYMLGVLNGKESIMRVRVDARNFDRLGVLTDGIQFGDQIGQFIYPMTLTFQGARDAVTIKSPGLSQFQGGTDPDYSRFGQYFYPAGRQLAGEETAPQFYDDIPLGNSKVVQIPGDTSGDPIIDPSIGTYPDPTNPPSQPTGGTSGKVRGNLP